MKIRATLLLLTLTCLASGCVSATVQDYSWRLTNRFRASKAYHEYHRSCPNAPSGYHFAAGFKRGYAKAAAGNCPNCPIVPPPAYWHGIYQGPHGQDKVECWYEGFQTGFSVAEQHCRPQWADVPTADGPLGPCEPLIDFPMPGCQSCSTCPDACY